MLIVVTPLPALYDFIAGRGAQEKTFGELKGEFASPPSLPQAHLHVRPAEHAHPALHARRPRRSAGEHRRAPRAAPHLQPGHRGPLHETGATPCRLIYFRIGVSSTVRQRHTCGSTSTRSKATHTTGERGSAALFHARFAGWSPRARIARLPGASTAGTTLTMPRV